MESIFGPVPLNSVNIEPSVYIEKWPLFNITSDVNFTSTSTLVPCILSSIRREPMSVLKLFCDLPN